MAIQMLLVPLLLSANIHSFEHAYALFWLSEGDEKVVLLAVPRKE